MEKYKNADKPETRCLRGLRRKPGSNQLGSSGSSEDAFAPRRVDTLIPSSPGTFPKPAENVTVKSLLAKLEQYKPGEWIEQQERSKEKRATWEASLPTNYDHHSNHVTPGHTLEYINQGKPSPKKKQEFNVSTKHKRRNSAQ
jgi:hypothetical protein